MALRVPKAEISGEVADSMIERFGVVTGIYVVRNPRKLTRLDTPAELAR